MDADTFLQNFAASLSADTPPSLSLDITFAEIEPYWDSLAVVMCLEMIDAEYGVSLTGDEVRTCTSLGELYRLIESRRAS